MKLAAMRFEEFTTAGFMRIEEGVLERVLDDDFLVARDEETMWEALVV